MTPGTVTSENLGERMFESAKAALGGKFDLVEPFLESESEKLAITLRMIIEASARDQITKDQAEILLNQQRVAVSAVLTAAEGMAILAVQAAINAALKEARDFVNGKIGFALL